jgi:cytochrome c oxidase subunit III
VTPSASGSAAAIPKERLPVIVSGTMAPVWWGTLLLVLIETIVFGSLISSYFYLRLGATEWPPGGAPPPELLLPIINTGVLFASAAAVFWATSGLRKGNVRRLKIGLGAGLVLEIVFFAIKLVMSGDVIVGWRENAYGSIFWSINHLHTAHVFVAIVMGCVGMLLVWRGYVTPRRRLPMEVVNIYWQFVTLIWMPVFIVLFLVPRWM